MEVKVQLHMDHGQNWHAQDHHRFLTPPCKPSRPPTFDLLSVPLRNKPNMPDHLLRDKTRLLQLADRIQTKKSPGNVNGRKIEDTLIPTPPRRSSSTASPRRRLSEDFLEIIENKPVQEPLFQKVGSTFRRSKLYASFSPKKRSLQKLVKSDPAKTNIEHLVHRTIHRDPDPKVNDLDSKVSDLEVNFHDKEKLSQIFSPGDAGPKKNGVYHKIGASEKGHENLAVSSSAPDKANFSESESPKMGAGMTEENCINYGSAHNGVGHYNYKCETKLEGVQIPNLNLVGNQFGKRNHEPLATSISHNSYLATREKEGDHRKRCRSIPRSFQPISNHHDNAITINKQSFWNDVGSEKVKGLERRRVSHVPCQNEGPTPQTPKSSAQMPSGTQGRPMSLDYSQRKAWLSVVGDMDLTSPAPTGLPPQVKRSKPKSKRPLSITHLHLVDSSAHDSPETSSLEENGENGSKSSTPSIFQRFSKTFSLRFGSATPKPKPRAPSGSSPDISACLADSAERLGSKNKPKKKVDPSSGKVRKRVDSNRDDKCQSGDSGIQLEADSTNRLAPTRNSSRSGSPISMQKLSLVEMGGEWEDAGFVSTNEEQEESRVPPNGTETLPPPDSYFRSLPLKYSRTRKAEMVLERKAVVRGSVVRELLTTEANYVKSLNDIVQGFVIPCRARSDLFNDKTVGNIFSNVEDILRLHAKILEALQYSVSCENVSDACVGHIFIQWAPSFDLYSEYCCQNPMSMATVRQLCLNREYADFFEACRRLQLMDKLPLHGFLLRPIQRICQYHLQLNELLKNTPPSHEDYLDVEMALKTMKDVALRMNDTQRQFDSLQEIVRLQSSIDAWEGDDLVPGSTTILHKGDLILTTLGHKPKEVYVVFLNNEILICRRDYYKKGTTSLFYRIPLLSVRWNNIRDEDQHFGAVANSWRIFNPTEAEWILLTAPSPADKTKWLDALERSRGSFPVDYKMSEMAKFTALKLMLTESHSQGVSAGGALFASGSTLPRLRKNRKSSSLTKSDSDAMLIEVGKLRKSNNYQHLNRGNSTESGTSLASNSKFYV